MHEEGKKLKLHFAFPVYVNANCHFGLHAHDYHELVIVQHGRFRSRVLEKEYIAFRGDVLLYTAHTPHEEWAEDGKPVLTWVCAFECDTLGPDDPVFRWDGGGKVQELLAYLTELHYIDETHHERHRHTIEAPPVLEELVTELKQLAAYEPHGMVAQVRAFIRASIADPLAVEDLATIAGLSKFHFTRQYRALTGRTPMEDVRFMRLEEARRLILTSPLPLGEIAPRVGIANEYHLSRLLRAHLGTGVRDLRPLTGKNQA